jgi:hypothetical protein
VENTTPVGCKAKKTNKQTNKQLDWSQLVRNYVLKHVIEGKIKIEMRGRRGRRRCKEIVDKLREKRG